MLDHEQEWIEKYRAALLQAPPSRRLRLAAAFNSLARALGFALGKTSGKLQSPPRNPLVSGPSSEYKIHQHSDPTGSCLQEESTGKNPADQHQEKKAS